MLEDERRWSKCDDNNRTREFENMSAWRVEDCPAYADTYIEWCFEKRCKEYGNGVYILTEWRERKKQYISYLRASVFDFQHYSRHDDSHSISILEAIEMLLGKERVDKLSIGDLWLLLESAYSHDMGMNLSYEELVNLWKRSEFKEYIEAVIHDERPGHDAVAFYKVVDNLLNGRIRFDNLEHYLERHPEVADQYCNIDESWPVAMERGIQEIVSEFIRKEHAKRLQDSINKLDENSDPIVPIRLYKLMVRVCICHGGTYDDILKLPSCEKGFGNSRIHPRFAAALLRMGDLLDMDNNRFNVRAIEHYGMLPYMSSLHYKKHRDITHLAIRPDRIEAEAVCTEADVCVVINSWFSMLSEEIKNLICHWNEMAPDDIKGCLLTINPFKIYYEKNGIRSLFYTHPESDFQVDKGKMIELLMGASIYRSRIDFIREYLQNALDASKMRLWTDLKNKRLEYTGKIGDKEDPRELLPFDLGSDIYDRYAIEVHIQCNIETQMVELGIYDRGIGMEEECLDVISNIGGGWRKRKRYRKDLAEMPKWLKPTGGFGIGIQSAFMVTDKVEIITRGVHEAEGRKIVLSNPKSEGRIVQESFSNVEAGTKVKVEFPLRCVLNVQKELTQFPRGDQEYEQYAYKPLEEAFSDENYFDAQAMQKYVFNFVYNYVSIYFCNTLIPIMVISEQGIRKETKVIKNETISKYNKYDCGEHVLTAETDIDGRHYHFFYDYALSDGKRSMLWCDEDASMAVIGYAPQTEYADYIGEDSDAKRQKENSENKRGFVCFKNVRVNRELSVREPYSSFYNVFEDFMGLRAEEILKVHREEFNTDFSWRIYADRFFQVYYKCLNVLGTNIAEKISKPNDKGEKVTAEENKQLGAIAEELLEPAAQIIQLLYLGIPLADVKKSEIMDQFKLSKEKSRVLLMTCIENEEPIDLVNGRISLADILEQMNEVLAYDAKTQEEQPCIFIKPINGEDNVECSLIGWKAKLDLLFRKKPETIGFYAEEYFKKILNECADEPFDSSLKSKLQEKLENRIFNGKDEKQQKLLESLDKAKMILTDRDIVALIEGYDGFEKEFFRLNDTGAIYAKITKKIQEARSIGEKEFYQMSYNREKHKSQIFSVRNTTWYPELRVKELPILKGGEETADSEYIISPISREIFNSVEKAQLGEDMKDNIGIDYSAFVDIVVNHSSYKALVQWVFDNQSGNGEKKLSKADIHKVYLQYIQKIYEVNKKPG